VSGEKSPPLSSTLENVEDFMVSTTTSETTTVVKGDGFEGVGIVDNPMCCATKLVVVKGRKLLKSWNKMTFNQIINKQWRGKKIWKGTFMLWTQ